MMCVPAYVLFMRYFDFGLYFFNLYSYITSFKMTGQAKGQEDEWSTLIGLSAVSRGHPTQRDCTNSSPHHQTADRVWVYPDEPGPG